MNYEDSFTIYLPSNSPGAEPLSLSEDQDQQISSHYKTTLDGTIDLDGDGWEVGLAEICFPSKLLSLLDGFEIGVLIVNPPKRFTRSYREKEVKQRNLATPPPRSILSVDDPLSFDDDEFYRMGEENADGQLVIMPPVMIGNTGIYLPSYTIPIPPNRGPTSETELPAADDAAAITSSSPSLPPAESTPTAMAKTGDVSSQAAENIGDAVTASSPSKNASIKPTEAAAAAAAVQAAPQTPKLVDRESLRVLNAGSGSFIGSNIMKSIGFRPKLLRPPVYANPETPGQINVDDIFEAYASGNVTVTGSIDGGSTTTTTTTTASAPVNNIGRIWYTAHTFSIAMGETVSVECKLYPELFTIPPGFYASRGELVNIMNERLAFLVNNRTFPNRLWSPILYEPYFHGRDSGMITVSAGFYEPCSSATSPYVHLVPTISSLRVLKFLGFNLSHWKWNQEMKTYVYTIPKDTPYIRRDQPLPITMPTVSDIEKEGMSMWRKTSAQIYEIYTAEEIAEIKKAREKILYESLEKRYVLNFSEQRKQLLKPKTTPPQFLFVYVDVARPVAIGNTRASVLRITSLKSREDTLMLSASASSQSSSSTSASALPLTQHPSFAKYYQNEPERFNQVIYVPVSRKSFNTITVFLSDENGSQLSFDEGTVYIVLQFRKRIPMSALFNAMSY